MLTRNGIEFAVASVALAIAGAVLDFSELVVLAVAIGLAVALAGLWLLARPRVDIRRTVPHRVAEGEPAFGVVHVVNTGRRRCPPLVATEHLSTGAQPVPVPSLAAGEEHHARYPLPTARRGRYDVGPMRTSHTDPFRLVSQAAEAVPATTLYVRPRIHRVPCLPTGRTQETEGRTSAAAPTGGVAFHSLRPYEPGDDVRLVHWRSTARLGTLMVRHTVVTHQPRLLVVLDTSAEPYDDESFEDAVRVTASLVAAGADQRFPVRLRTSGGLNARVDVDGRGLEELMDALATIERGDDDPGLDALATMVRRREPGLSLGVVTGLPAVERAEVVGRVRRRFDMVSLVQLGERLERPPIRLTGVLSVGADTSAGFVRAWTARVR